MILWLLFFFVTWTRSKTPPKCDICHNIFGVFFKASLICDGNRLPGGELCVQDNCPFPLKQSPLSKGAGDLTKGLA